MFEGMNELFRDDKYNENNTAVKSLIFLILRIA